MIRLKLVKNVVWRIWAICSTRGDDPIQSIDATEDEHAAIAAFLDRISAEGTSWLPDNRNHEINSEPKILQFTVGKYRLPYFFDGKGIIIIVHTYKKRGGSRNQIRRSDKQIAINGYRDYHEAKESDSIEYIEQDEE